MDSIQKRPSGASLFLATLVLIAAGAIATTRTLTAAATTPSTSLITARPANTVQLADEITRRLRRIGISFTRTRLPHPYDPAGEIC